MKSLKIWSGDHLSAAQFQKLFEELDKDAIKQVCTLQLFINTKSDHGFEKKKKSDSIMLGVELNTFYSSVNTGND